MAIIRVLTKDLFNDSVFYRNLFKIAIPITIQNFIGSALNMIDTVMVGKLGEAQIASVGIANQVFFLFSLIIFGLYSGCGVFISQFWGIKDIKNIRRMLGIALYSGVFVSLIFTLFGLFIPDKIIGIFNNDKHVISIGASFLRILCLSYIFTAVTFCYSFSSRCIGNALVPMIISAIALLTNTVLNYILIFGKYGFEAMGVEGAALATLIARIVESIMMIIYIYKTKNVLSASFKEMTDLTKDFIKKSFKTITPVLLNEFCWGFGMVVYTIAYGNIGTKAMASIQICTTIQNLFMVVIFGMGNACTVMIGNKIGAGDEETGKLYAKRFSILSCIVGLLMSVGLYLSAPKILEFFNVSSSVLNSSLMILYITSAIMVIRVFNIILIVGILRGGGDVKYSLMAEASTMWLIGVPLAFLGSFLFKLPIHLVFALVTIEEIAKCIIGVIRLLSNKWIKNVIHNM